jgi:hypothetical protein
MRKLIVVAVALSCFACASSDDGGAPGTDTGTSGTDSSTTDTGRTDTRIGDDTAVDSSTPADTGIDAPLDSGSDVTPGDASTDTSDAAGDVADTREVASDGATPTSLRIDEIYVDLDLSGDAVEFVEIAGPPDTSLDGLHLRLIDPTGKVKYDVAITSGKKLGSSGRWVVGGNRTDTFFTGGRLDQSVSIASWGLDNTAGAVQLVSGTTLLDVVGYGAKPAPPATPPTATYETDVAPLPATVKNSLARRGGVDTNDNAADFCAQSGNPGSAGTCP